MGYRVPLMLLIMILTFGCSDESESAAQELYDIATQHRKADQYQRAMAILQEITIDYGDTEVGKRAEEEISELRTLEEMKLQNQARKIQTSFSSIGRALENYKARFLVYPMTPKDLDKLPAVVVPDWDDVWGKEIFYTPIYSKPDLAKHLPDGYALASFGMDGLPGGERQNKDHFYKNGKIVSRVTE